MLKPGDIVVAESLRDHDLGGAATFYISVIIKEKVEFFKVQSIQNKRHAYDFLKFRFIKASPSIEYLVRKFYVNK